MVVTARSEPTTPDTLTAGGAVDRQQWWADVQSGVADLLTAAAHPAERRLAG